MDPRVVKVLHDAFLKGLDEPANLATMAQFDQERFYLSSADYNKLAMQQIVEQKKMIEELGLKEN
jgi:tripartite-type tricarboxylate transporter receptor subunit TctC